MINELWQFLMDIPLYLGEMTNWLITPIDSLYLNISPLGLISLSGVGVLIAIIGVHVVRLFV